MIENKEGTKQGRNMKKFKEMRRWIDMEKKKGMILNLREMKIIDKKNIMMPREISINTIDRAATTTTIGLISIRIVIEDTETKKEMTDIDSTATP